MAEEIECPVCLVDFQEPRILHCGHSLCANCLRNLGGVQAGAQIQCPLCQQYTSVPQRGLIVNYDLIAVIAKLKTIEVLHALDNAPLDKDAFAMIGSRHNVVVSSFLGGDELGVQPLRNGPHITKLAGMMNAFYDDTAYTVADLRRLGLTPPEDKAPVKQVDVARATAAVKAPASRSVIFCAAPFGDNGFRRATIVDRLSAGRVRVHFVDYEKNGEVDIKTLMALPKTFRTLPSIALRCRLIAPLPPPPQPEGDEATESAKGTDDELMDGRRLSLFIAAVGADGVPVVRAYNS